MIQIRNVLGKNIRKARVQWSRMALAIVLVASLLLGAALPPTPAAATGTAHQMVPAYFYPDWWNTGNAWYTMCDSLDSSGDGSTAIMNPNSGPGSAVNSDYQNVLEYCEDRGINVIGYVHTSYGARNIADVKADIDDYYSWYTGVDGAIDGIFLDEMSNDSSTSTYYEELYDYIHTVGGSGADDVVGNPGVAATTDWQLDTPVVDELVVFENTATVYASWTPPSWISGYPSTDFVHLVHAANPSNITALCTKAAATNGHHLYFTQDVLSNPWDTWDSMVLAC